MPSLILPTWSIDILTEAEVPPSEVVLKLRVPGISLPLGLTSDAILPTIDAATFCLSVPSAPTNAIVPISLPVATDVLEPTDVPFDLPIKKKAPSPYNNFMAKCSVKPNKDFGKCAAEWGKMTDSAKAKYK